MKVILVHTKRGTEEAIEVEWESLLEEIVEAVKAIVQKKFREQDKKGPE